jgi:hypothetical protein
MASFNFTGPSGQVFEIKGPEGLTLEQAKSVFDQQTKTGSLVGFKPGEVLSASTQAADGLAGAQAALAQAQSGITGALGNVIGSVGNLGKALPSIGAAGGNLTGSISGIAAGISGAVGNAVSAGGKVLGSISSSATNIINTINKNLTAIPTPNAIGISNFATTIPSLTSIGSMSESAVTSTLATAKNAVGQASNILSDAKGVGSFGFDAKQLETAGILKPGTSSLISGATGAAASLSSLLKSPSVFTGKGGIKSVEGLLSSPQAQSGIQQGLMSKGVNGLASLGVPTTALSAQGLAGVALNAAKSIPDTAAFLNKLPIPNDPTGAISAQFGANITNGAFGVNLSDIKVPNSFKETEVPVPAADTVNRATLDAASTRIVGNDKVPVPNYGPPMVSKVGVAEIIAAYDKVDQLIKDTTVSLNDLTGQLTSLENRATITQQEWDNVNGIYQQIRQNYNSSSTLITTANSIYDKATPEARQQAINLRSILASRIQNLLERNAQFKTRIAELQKKITSPEQ